MHRRFVLALAACLLLMTPGAPARAESFTPEQTKAIEALIRDTIANHPEIVIDALRTAQQKDRRDAA